MTKLQPGQGNDGDFEGVIIGNRVIGSMTSPGARKELYWLEDINEAIDKIESHEQRQHGKEALEADEHYRVWVFYHIERIGACASQLRRDFDYDNKYPEIDWKGAQAIRRYLVHRYGMRTKTKFGKAYYICQKSKRRLTS